MRSAAAPARAGREQVRDGRRDVACVRRPRAGAGVQLGDVRLGPGLLQLPPQDLAEDVVVAEPRAPLVERDEEQVRPLDVAQERLRPVLVADGVAQRCVEAVEDARVEQERARLGRLGGEDLVAQVVDEMPVVAEILG